MKIIKYFGQNFLINAGLASIIALGCLQSASAADLTTRQQGLIEGALTYHPNLVIARIQVDVDKGHAQLKGIVDSHVGRALAEELAANVKGIRSVSNQLRVAPEYFSRQKEETYKEKTYSGEVINRRLSNVTISNKVKSQLLANRVTSGMHVEVETDNRVVTINGQVRSEAEKALTYWIVKNTQGVRTVINNLDILTEREQRAFVQVAEQ